MFEKKEEKITASMFGGFHIEYNGKPFSIERNTVTKVNQLVQMLMYYREGISRIQIIENLFGHDDIADPSNSLRALVFRVRRTLPKYGLPEDDEYIYIKRGFYSWSPTFTVDCDATNFENTLKKAAQTESDTERLALFEEAFDIYKGDFLPELSGEEWVVPIQVRLRKMFKDITRVLCEHYLGKENYKRVYELSKKATDLYPYDEWQYYQMKALIEMGKTQEAMALYEETEKDMFSALGVSVSPQMKEMLDKLGAQVKYGTDMISTVQDNLENTKEDIEGAFYCTYPVFIETYRYIKRVIRRSGQAAWLMLCTLTDGKGIALDNSDRLNMLADELSEAVRVSARGGDMYARYSNNQFIVLLLGISQEDCSLVENRINEHMAKESRKRYIKYTLAPVNLASAGTDRDADELKDMVRGDK
ncbi:MAG: bacterial transcriptional activator domain-containing protein [Pseudobutyrivibrio sp.]|nr:bacterial transcriptional activator domain-containing protein [Pseudobutyrivibrio sp.]